MTDRSRGLPVATIAAALFLVVLIYLALQVRAGRDPAIGASKSAADVPRQVSVRRIIVRRVIEDDAPRVPRAAAPAQPAATPSPAAAPAPPPAPAPAEDRAPAPPVVSRGS
jgi:hypothetical protein